MDCNYYDMIFKRKSFHIFTGEKHLSEKELEEIQRQTVLLKPLVKDIKVAFRIVPRNATTCKRGEYCILIYSEEKENYLQNVGYIGEQLDLWLASQNIGVCWYGMGKTTETEYMGLPFVIMLAIEKVEKTQFRKDYTKTKRKKLEDIWYGEEIKDVSAIVKYAPSACNTQPWLVKCKDNFLQIYRVSKKRGMMPKDKIVFYNQIDIGIFLLFLELCLEHGGYNYTRTLYGKTDDKDEESLTATYSLCFT